MNLSYEQQIITACIIYILAFIYSITIAPILNNNSTIIKNIHESCFYKCRTSECKKISSYKGKGYYIGSDKNAKDCLFTLWNISHIFLYAILGYLCPDLFLETLITGVLFEGYERKKHNCGDILDIFCNTAGFLIGRYVNLLSNDRAF